MKTFLHFAFQDGQIRIQGPELALSQFWELLDQARSSRRGWARQGAILVVRTRTGSAQQPVRRRGVRRNWT